MVRLLASFALLLALLAPAPAGARVQAEISQRGDGGAVPLLTRGRAAAVLIDIADDPGAIRAARDLAADFGRVGGRNAELLTAPPARGEALVIVGTAGRSPLIDCLVRS